MVLFKGSNTEFYFAKILVNIKIKDSELISLSWCECDRAITS
jgi:hypothetical protein